MVLTDSGAKAIDDTLYKIGTIMGKFYENNKKKYPKRYEQRKAFKEVIDEISFHPVESDRTKSEIDKISRHLFFTDEEYKRHLARHGKTLYFPIVKQPQYGALGNDKTSRILLAAYMQYIAQDIIQLARHKIVKKRDDDKINASDIKAIIDEDEEFSNILKMKPPSSSNGSSTDKKSTRSSSPKPTTTKKDYDKMTVAQLYTEAQELKIPGRSNLRKEGKAALLAAVKKANLKK
jgi:hypothetical protein